MTKLMAVAQSLCEWFTECEDSEHRDELNGPCHFHQAEAAGMLERLKQSQFSIQDNEELLEVLDALAGDKIAFEDAIAQLGLTELYRS